MENSTQNDESFERLKEKLFGGKKNDEKKKEEFLSNIDKKIKEEEEMERKKKEQEWKEFQIKLSATLQDSLKSKPKDPLLDFPFLRLGSEIEKGYRFSDSLKINEISRIDISSWEYSANFLINYCNSFTLSKSENEEIEELKKNRHLAQTISELHKGVINEQVFSEIINRNKPFISLNLNPISFLRKNVLFLILYVTQIERGDKKKEFNTEQLAKYWIRALVNHTLFSNIKACNFLRKEYRKITDKGKLSTVKYFNTEVLGSVEIILKEQSLEPDWITPIRKTYSRLYGNDYEICKPEQVTLFSFFTRDELELFAYILQYHISISNNFPQMFENLIYKLLAEEGFPMVIFENLMLELSSLDQR